MKTALFVAFLALLPFAAEARPSSYAPVTAFEGDRYTSRVVPAAHPQRQAKQHHRHYRRHARQRVPVVRQIVVAEGMTREAARVIGGRPAGCPHAFCGCGASLHLFGRIIPALNLAANWLRFPHAEPAPKMVAARRGHVFVLERHIAGSIWLVHDSNSGGHRTRLHPRSIAGYAIVNPHGST